MAGAVISKLGGKLYKEGYSGARFVTRSLFPIAPCRHNKDDLFMKGFSYHTTSQEQAIACTIPPGSTMKKSLTPASGSIPRNGAQQPGAGRHVSDSSNRWQSR